MTKIEWATESWNPVTGCTPVGEGCRNCYAKRQAERLQRMGVLKYRHGFKVTCHPNELDAKVLRKRKPQRIFVCSMSDLFHEKVSQLSVEIILNAIAGHSQHTFVVLTKRINRARTFAVKEVFPDNIWLGVSVSTQREADEWIPILLQCPAAKRIVSYEPALEPINWRPFIKDIDQLICGCESGPGRRHFDENWARDTRDACQEAGVPFFFKQTIGFGNKVVHRPFLDGRRYEEYP